MLVDSLAQTTEKLGLGSQARRRPTSGYTGRGAAAELGLDVVHSPAQELLKSLKAAREAAGLTLADVSARCGIDQAALSLLEDGHTHNPTLDTLWRYAAATGKRLVLSAEDIPDTRPVPSNAARPVPEIAAAREKTA